MERPGPALIGSIVVHAVAVGAVLLGMLSWERPPTPMVNAVPVSIVSDMVIEAAAADNPSEELVTEDATTAPVAAPPEPVPAPPEPTPPAPTPRPTPPAPAPVPVKKAPTPRPTPTPAPPRAQPTPPRPTPARPAAPRREETLDLDALAGPARPATRPGTRPATGQQGQGAASQATGPQVTAITAQIQEQWDYNCDLPGARDLVVPVQMTIDARGRVTSTRFQGSGNSSAWQSAIDTMRRAIAAAQPLRVPEGWTAQTISVRFRGDIVCRNQ